MLTFQIFRLLIPTELPLPFFVFEVVCLVQLAAISARVLGHLEGLPDFEVNKR
jgi:hypothetical protein